TCRLVSDPRVSRLFGSDPTRPLFARFNSDTLERPPESRRQSTPCHEHSVPTGPNQPWLDRHCGPPVASYKAMRTSRCVASMDWANAGTGVERSNVNSQKRRICPMPPTRATVDAALHQGFEESPANFQPRVQLREETQPDAISTVRMAQTDSSSSRRGKW